MTELEELQFLRKKLAEQEAIIRRNEHEISKREQLISKQEQALATQEHTIKEREELIKRQAIQIENMTQALLHAQRKIFGASTEASKQIPGQGSLFDTIEPLVSELLKDQQKIAEPKIVSMQKIIFKKQRFQHHYFHILLQQHH